MLEGKGEGTCKASNKDKKRHAQQCHGFTQGVMRYVCMCVCVFVRYVCMCVCVFVCVCKCVGRCVRGKVCAWKGVCVERCLWVGVVIIFFLQTCSCCAQHVALVGRG